MISANSFSYCSEKVCQPGSSLHYALLFQNPEDRAFWLGCFTLAHEIRSTSMKQLEAGLTQVKLGWWRNALVDAKTQASQHPIIQAIGQHHINAVPEAAWGDLIEQMVDSCEVKRHNTLADWHATTLRELEPWSHLIAVKAGVSDTKQLHELLNFWAWSIELCQLLRLAKYLDENFQPVPVDWLQQHEVTAEQVRQRAHDEKTTALFISMAKTLQEEAELAWKRLPQTLRLFARPLRALFRMRVAEFNLHKPSNYLLLTEQKMLTPWKKFSISWTTQVLRW
ncbi:squalene/phytoene synthase family protein [Limnobacter sp.]|uniref:squalene/phytoene synthase family protein n=1 Tax=Limnobacter sp. TaxID=2003368 RepID=UPI00258DFC89|nr:squalene/phytoene synthase family protein [Limnobacter sp.]